MSTPKTFETAFDFYDVVNVIGEGGAGRVFRVNNSEGKPLALKCLRPELTSSEKRKRFKNEINFCTKNNHPNLIQVLDWGVVEWDKNKTLFYVMPLYPKTLREVMRAGINLDNVLHIFGQMLDGVEAAHILGVTHRDLKPENILCDQDNHLYVVADFGIAHFEEEMLATAVETKKSERLLNIGYSAPEQRTKGAPVDKSADIYALGQMLNEMFTGSIPEGAGHATVSKVAPEFAYLDELIEQMRQQTPSARPSIEEIKKQLIGRRNEFFALQRLDAKKNEVIKASTPGTILPITITDANWEPNILTITLNRVPEPKWVQFFLGGRLVTGYLLGLQPTAYQFRGNSVVVTAEERSAQTAIDQFNAWAPRVTSALQEEVIREAQLAEQKQRRQLEQEIAAAEARARVTRQLKF